MPTVRCIAILMLFLTTGAATSGGVERADERPLKEIPLDASLLATGRPQTYGILTPGASREAQALIGYKSKLVLTTSVEGGSVVMKDRLELPSRSFEMRLTCDSAPLLPLRRGEHAAVQRIGKGEQTHRATVEVADGELKLSSDRVSTSFPWPEGTLTQGATMRVIPQLPREPGVRYTFAAYSEMSSMRPQLPSNGVVFSIECVGPEATRVFGATIACTRYDLHVGKTTSFFVDDAGVLRRILADGGETELVLVDREFAEATP